MKENINKNKIGIALAHDKLKDFIRENVRDESISKLNNLINNFLEELLVPYESHLNLYKEEYGELE